MWIGSTRRLESQPSPEPLLRIPPHGHTVRCNELARAAPLLLRPHQEILEVAQELPASLVVEPHGLSLLHRISFGYEGRAAMALLQTLCRAQPSEAHPPSPRLRRVPTSHSSTVYTRDFLRRMVKRFVDLQRKQAMLAASYGRPLSCPVLLPVSSDFISSTIRGFWQPLRPCGRLDNDINLL